MYTRNHFKMWRNSLYSNSTTLRHRRSLSTSAVGSRSPHVAPQRHIADLSKGLMRYGCNCLRSTKTQTQTEVLTSRGPMFLGCTSSWTQLPACNSI